MVLYHATYRKLLGKIRKEGIRPQRKKSYQGQVGEGLIYFAMDLDVAEDMAEGADNIAPYLEEDAVVILAVNSEVLDKRNLCIDPNVVLDTDEEPYSIAFKGSVSPQLLGICNLKTKKIIPLNKVSRLNNEFYYN